MKKENSKGKTFMKKSQVIIMLRNSIFHLNLNNIDIQVTQDLVMKEVNYGMDYFPMPSTRI